MSGPDEGTDGPPRTTQPDGQEGGEVLLDGAEARRVRALVKTGVVLVAVMAVALGVTIPRSLSYTALVDENLLLKDELRKVDQKMSEIERVLLRLRLYESQIDSLSRPDGEAGPLSREDFANARRKEATEALVPLLADSDADWDDDGGMRPPAEWAQGVTARADTFLTLFARAEPDLTAFVEDMEGLHALERALPSFWPANGPLTSGYGWRRNPLGHRWRFHSGVDIEGKRHQPIYAAADGVVHRAYFNEGYGRMIELDHGFGIATIYAHCTRLMVKEGAQVTAGQQIATIGTTGRSTGPHLHFEVRLDGHAVDPLDYIHP